MTFWVIIGHEGNEEALEKKQTLLSVKVTDLHSSVSTQALEQVSMSYTPTGKLRTDLAYKDKVDSTDQLSLTAGKEKVKLEASSSQEAKRK